MRLSATERIIREAEEAEAKAVLDQQDDTKVSYIRSAEALEKLRSFELPSPPPERDRARSRESYPRLPAPASVTGRRLPAGLPPGRPKPAVEPEPHPTEVLTVDLPFPLTDAPEAPVPPVEVAEPQGVGRRLGFFIAAATAATVVLVFGAWMAHTGKLGRIHVSIASPAPSPSVVVPPSSGPLIAPIVERPLVVVAPAPEPPQPVPSPPTANLVDEDVASPKEAAAPQVAPPVVEPETRAAPAKKSRPAHKASGGKANKRKAHGAKAGKGSRAAHARSTRSAATPQAPARKTPKISDSPDDVLPMSAD